MTAANWIELARALAPLAWPVLAAVVCWRIFPLVKSIASSRSFTIEVAGMKVGVQDATEQLRTQIEDLQKQVIALRQDSEGLMRFREPDRRADVRSANLLWVDDNPSNNAFEIAQLEESGVSVSKATSTQDAEAILRSRKIDAVISDMGRKENGSFNPRAGLDLLTSLREGERNVPFLIYSSERSAKNNRAAVINAGGDGATASAIDLLEWVADKFPVVSLR